jgi:hypothetical protein
MMCILEDVIPIGTPWGGPESNRYLSSFVSMLMKIEQHAGVEEELHRMHEKLYCLYLTITGIGVSVFWDERLAPLSDEQVVKRFCSDYIERSMAYAGYGYSVATRDDICADADAAKRRIAASIDAGVPVLACLGDSQWSIVTGYDDGDTLIGWDGAQTYWGPPAVKPDGYLESQMFATASWPDTVSRFVIVEGKTAPQAATCDVLRHLVSLMEQQRSKDYSKEFMARLQDDAYCASADQESLQNLWGYANQYAGWYAENRAFAAVALTETLSTLADVRENAPFVDYLRRTAGYMFHTHDISWEVWRVLRTTHRCNLPDNVPCGWCGGCLRPADDGDYPAFRKAETRRKLAGYLQVMDWNDGKVLERLQKCLELL